MKRRFKPPRLPSAEAHRVMERALKDLNKTVTTSGSRNIPETSLQEVQKSCLQIEDSLAARGLLRNTRRLARLFGGLEHYRRSIDVLCNGTEYLCWIWSPISVILQMASDCISAFEIIMKAYTKIGDTLRRFEKLRETFFEDHWFQELLAVFYADILRFHGLAYKFSQRSSWEVFLLTTCGRFERRFTNVIENLENHAKLITEEGHVLNITETQRKLGELLSQQQEGLRQIEVEEERYSERQFADTVSRLQVDGQDQIAIFDSVSECLKYEGTCAWALNQGSIASWLNCDGRVQSLWLHGSAGTGKSVLSAHLVTFAKSNGSSRVIYHFCSDQYRESKSYDQILRSIIRQLLQLSVDAIAHAHNTFLKSRKTPSLPELEKLVGELLTIISADSEETGPVWVVVDGVDECEPDKLPRLINVLAGRSTGRAGTGLSSKKESLCKVMFTSRRVPVFERAFRNLSVVSLGEESVKNDVRAAIGTYVSHRVRSPENSRRWKQLEFKPHELDEIECEIVQKADGMFLYARLILDYLGSQLFRNKSSFRAKVSRLPKTLHEFYSRLLENIISGMDGESRGIVKTIFRWVAFSKRPLRRLEFLSAITFSEGDSDASALVPDHVLDACVNLVEVRHDRTVTFIHGSVKEFLMSPESNFSVAEGESIEEQARAIISCIISASRCFHPSSGEGEKRMRVVKGLYGLVLYASEHWVEFMLESGPREYPGGIEALVVELERRNWNAETETQQSNMGPETYDPRLSLFDEFPRLQDHIRCAIASRTQDALERLGNIATGEDQEQGRRPSQDAVSRILEAYQETVRFLLDPQYYSAVLAEDHEAAEDLKAFKAEFSATSFTCRLRSCPRATIGFESKRELEEHEWAHTSRPRCTIAGCEYPPFVNDRALKRHKEKCHPTTQPVRQLRRVSRIPESRNPTSVGREAQGTPITRSRTARLERKADLEHILRYMDPQLPVPDRKSSLNPRPVISDSSSDSSSVIILGPARDFDATNTILPETAGISSLGPPQDGGHRGNEAQPAPREGWSLADLAPDLEPAQSPNEPSSLERGKAIARPLHWDPRLSPTGYVRRIRDRWGSGLPSDLVMASERLNTSERLNIHGRSDTHERLSSPGKQNTLVGVGLHSPGDVNGLLEYLSEGDYSAAQQYVAATSKQASKPEPGSRPYVQTPPPPAQLPWPAYGVSSVTSTPLEGPGDTPQIAYTANDPAAISAQGHSTSPMESQLPSAQSPMLWAQYDQGATHDTTSFHLSTTQMYSDPYFGAFGDTYGNYVSDEDSL